MSAKPTAKKIRQQHFLQSCSDLRCCNIAALVTNLFLNIYTRHGQNVVVPQLQGFQEEEAIPFSGQRVASGCRLDIQKGCGSGSIIDQTPKPNQGEGGSRDLCHHLLRNPQQVSVPGLVDFPRDRPWRFSTPSASPKLRLKRYRHNTRLVISVEYRGRKLLPDEQIPAGSPLKLVVGSGMAKDSLNMSREIVVPRKREAVTGSTQNRSPHNRLAWMNRF